MNAAEHARIFGPREAGPPGRSRRCISCGDWHRLDKPWPHNCRPPAPPRSDLAAPMLAPTFHPFVAGDVFDPVEIGDPKAKREYMEARDLVDWDSGVRPEPEQTERQWEEEFVTDLKRSVEQDPLAVKPVDIIGRTDLDGTGEIETDGMEIFE